jgi:mediator of RNA polymerase II transcription subunit 25
MATALHAFDDLQSMRESVAVSVKPDAQKHCILITNSQPYDAPVFESTTYSGMTLEDIVTEMAKRDIHLSIFSPRKMSYLFKLFEKSGGDLQHALSRNYAKDRRHLILLNGFQLQERPASPPHTATTSPAVAAVTGQGVKRPASPASRPSSAGPAQTMPPQMAPNAGVQAPQRPLPPPPPPFTPAQRPGTRSPVPSLRPGAPVAPAPRMSGQQPPPPQTQQPQMLMQPNQNTGPMVRMTARAQRMPANQFPANGQQVMRQTGPPQQLQQQAPPNRMPVQGIPANQNVMIQQMQQQQMVQQQQQMQQQQQLQFQQQQLQMQGQPAVGLQIGQVMGQSGSLQGLLISGQQPQMQQPQVAIQLNSIPGQQITIQDQSGMAQQLMQQHPGDMNQPITIQMVTQPAAGQQQLIGPAGQTITLTSGDMNQQPVQMMGQQPQPQQMQPQPGQQPQMVAQMLSQGQLPQAKQRKMVWSGLMNYEDKSPGPNVVKTTYRLPCQISSLISGSDPNVAEADTTGWPSSLNMQLLPRQLMMKMMDTLKNQSVHVWLHLDQNVSSENKPGYDKLIKSMSSVSAGCIQFQAQGQSQMRIMIIIYVEEKKIFYGFIPNQQESFFQQMKIVVQNHKKQQQEQEKLRIKVSNRLSCLSCPSCPILILFFNPHR